MTEKEAFDLMSEVVDHCGSWQRAEDCETCPAYEHIENCNEWLFDEIRRARG